MAINIRDLRRKAGLTQLQLGQLLGRDPSLVSRLERGLVQPGGHDLDVLEALRRALRRKKNLALARILREHGRLSAISRLAVT